MSKFIRLTAVSYFTDSAGKTLAEEHDVILKQEYIGGITDFSLPMDDFNFIYISKGKYNREGSKIILNANGKKFFENHFFRLSECNGIICNNSFLVTEELDEIEKRLNNKTGE